MGLDVYSNVVYGKVISKEVLTQRQMVRACDHQIDESKKFCPECGKPVWVETENVMLDPQESNGLSYFYSDYENQNQVIVGFRLGETGSHRNNNDTTFFKLKNQTPQMTQELIAFFSQRGITTTDKDFAMHLFQYYSY
jgi:hypothetical protein